MVIQLLYIIIHNNFMEIWECLHMNRSEYMAAMYIPLLPLSHLGQWGIVIISICLSVCLSVCLWCTFPFSVLL